MNNELFRFTLNVYAHYLVKFWNRARGVVGSSGMLLTRWSGGNVACRRVHKAFAQYATQLSSWVASASAVCTEFATSSRRLPTNSVAIWKLTRLHSGLTTWILIDIDNFFNDDVIMSSLVTDLNSSTAQEIVNWLTTADGCVHSHRRYDSTRQLSRVGAGGVYWALVFGPGTGPHSGYVHCWDWSWGFAVIRFSKY